MSLINDALKRAAEAQKQTSSEPPPTMPLQPVDYAARSNPLFRALVFFFLLSAVALSVWYFSKWWHSNQQLPMRAAQSADATPAVEAPRPPAEALPGTEPLVSRPPIKVSTNIVFRDGRAREAESPATPPVETNVGSAPALETNALPKPAPAPPSFPELKLQSIIYRLNSPAVVINGEMLHAGEEIKGVRVVTIDRYAVIVEWQGERRELSLPRL